MELKRKLYSFDEAAELLSVSVQEVQRLVAENELSKWSGISGQSIQTFAARKRITLKQESASG